MIYHYYEQHSYDWTVSSSCARRLVKRTTNSLHTKNTSMKKPPRKRDARDQSITVAKPKQNPSPTRTRALRVKTNLKKKLYGQLATILLNNSSSQLPQRYQRKDTANFIFNHFVEINNSVRRTVFETPLVIQRTIVQGGACSNENK